MNLLGLNFHLKFKIFHANILSLVAPEAEIDLLGKLI